MGTLKTLLFRDDSVGMKVYVWALGLVVGAGCSSLGGGEDLRLELEQSQQQAQRLQRDVERLHADIRQAEETLITIESGLKGVHTRAEAVSALADSRILVERAAKLAPWRATSAQEAREKLVEADRHVQAGHFGSAIFFTSRARRIASTLILEAEAFTQARKVRYVNGPKANLRSQPSTGGKILEVLGKATPVIPDRLGGSWIRVRTPSGRVGWIYAKLLSEQR